MYDLAIIGGGAAGLTSALYAGRIGLKTILIEKVSLGGIASATAWVENYPGYPEGLAGIELMKKFETQANKYGAEIKIAQVVDIEFGPEEHIVKTKKEEYHATTIIIATGVKPKRLNVPGEEKFFGRGISFCATCDGPLYKDKDIVVVGTGNSGLQEGMFLTKFARNISFVEILPNISADKVLQDRIASYENVAFYLNYTVVAIEGERFVEKVRIKDRRTKKDKIIPAQGVFVYVGFLPETDFLKGKIKIDGAGYIVTDETMATSAPGVFAAGDVRRKLFRQISIATGEGTTAALMAYHYIERKKLV